ncbi:MAG: hypothetical protein ABIT37_07085 [Luteolibacter sp.]
MKISELVVFAILLLATNSVVRADDLVAPSEAQASHRFSEETERAFKQEAAADFVAWYSTDGKLDIGVGRTDKEPQLHHPIRFPLGELEDFFDAQKHKDLIVVGIEKNTWSDEELKRHVEKLRIYFLARGYSRVVIQQGLGSGRGIHLDYKAKKEAEQVMPPNGP